MATTTTTMRAWTPTAHADYDALTGKDVFSRDGEKVGTIKEVFHPNMEMPAARGRHVFRLDPGLLKDWFGGFDTVYLPESALETVDDDRVTIRFTKDEVKKQDWTREPADFGSYRRA